MEPFDGGVPRYVAWLAAGLHDRGWPVHVAARADTRVRDELERAGIVFHALPLSDATRGSTVTLRALRELDARKRFAIVHAHSSFAGAAARTALSRASRRVVYSPHCPAFLSDLSRPVRLVSRAAEQALVARTARIAAVGTWEADAVSAALRGARARMRVIVAGPPPPAGAAPDARLADFAAGAPLAGFVAALRPQKDPVAVVHAAALLSAVGRLDGRIAIVGDGPLAGAVDDAIADARIGDRVRRFDFGGASEPHLRALDLMILPSRWEASPLAILEAFACGVPVVATDTGGVRDMLDDGRAGGLVAPRDAAALAAVVGDALADPGLRARWATAGSEHLAARHRPAQMLDAAEAIYAELSA